MRKTREKADTAWKSNSNQISTTWESRTDTDTSWKANWRDKRKTRSRNYMLWSFFATLLTAITDTKDWKAIRIKCDPAYISDSEYRIRTEGNTERKVRFRL